MSQGTVGRGAGVSTLVAAVAFFGAGAAEGGVLNEQLGSLFIAGQSLLLIPVAGYLWHRLRPVGARVAAVAGVAGIAALLLWGSAPFTGAWALEPVWIALQALWWIGMGLLLRRFRRAWGTFTVVVGVAAVLDAAVTALEDHMPFVAFAILGGPKIPLSLVWMISTGLTVVRRPLVGPNRQPAKA